MRHRACSSLPLPLCTSSFSITSAPISASCRAASSSSSSKPRPPALFVSCSTPCSSPARPEEGERMGMQRRSLGRQRPERWSTSWRKWGCEDASVTLTHAREEAARPTSPSQGRRSSRSLPSPVLSRSCHTSRSPPSRTLYTSTRTACTSRLLAACSTLLTSPALDEATTCCMTCCSSWLFLSLLASCSARLAVSSRSAIT
mmetsp:Transcript_18403/g.41908  ORF Transcript_18403/g.41908 Transcript_18403/m.41908 type:complete len:201 (-) Transcript_18403:1322-1924(-)